MGVGTHCWKMATIMAALTATSRELNTWLQGVAVQEGLREDRIKCVWWSGWLLSLLRADGGVGPLRQHRDRDPKPRPADADSLPDWLGPNNTTSSVQPQCGRPQACCCLLPI